MQLSKQFFHSEGQRKCNILVHIIYVNIYIYIAVFLQCFCGLSYLYSYTKTTLVLCVNSIEDLNRIVDIIIKISLC